MRKTFFLFSLIIILATNCYSQPGILGSQDQTVERITNIKRSTVQILVNNAQSGTGFFVSQDGMIITNWHVIDVGKQRIIGDFSNFKAVTYKNDTLELKLINYLFSPKFINEAKAFDYCVLSPKKKLKTEYFLNVGSSKETPEGTTVYTCGFPLNMKVSFISTGMLSTKYDENILVNGKNYKRDLMYLDLTVNKGNSGGALMVMGKTVKDDKVIGITTFIIIPYGQYIKEVNDFIDENSKRGSIAIQGLDYLGYAKLVNDALSSNSIGISGAISIDCVKEIIK